MIKNGVGGANTQTGTNYEKQVQAPIQGEGWINVSKYNLYSYLKSIKIDWENIISKKLLPDEAYFNPITKEFKIFEKKFQQTSGSVDEKPQTCGFKIKQFEKIGKALGAISTTYTYIFNNWFKKPEYKDMLEYIDSVPGCGYIFME